FSLADVDGDNSVILSTSNFVITEQDLDAYLMERGIDPERRAEVLGKAGAVTSALENMLSIKHFASKAEVSGAVSPAELVNIDRIVEIFRSRLLMNRQLESEVADRLEGFDWESAAQEEYLANRSQYVTSEAVKASHIL